MFVVGCALFGACCLVFVVSCVVCCEVCSLLLVALFAGVLCVWLSVVVCCVLFVG